MRNLISIHVHLSQVSSIKHLHLESELLVLFWFLPRMNDYQGHNHGPQRMQPNNWPWSQGMVHSWSGCHCCPADPRRLPGGNQGVPRHMGPIGHPPQGPIGHAPMALTQAWHGSDLLKKIYDILPMKLGTRWEITSYMLGLSQCYHSQFFFWAFTSLLPMVTKFQGHL